jgi:hypothetical protein
MVRKQGIQKRMVRFKMLINNIFIILNGHNIYCRQQKHQRFVHATSTLLRMLTAGPRDQFTRWLAVGEVLLCTPFWGVQICDSSVA